MSRLALILAVLSAAPLLAVSAAPRLTVDLRAYDFPDTVEGMGVSHTYFLTNTGDEELVIADVKVTCSCTTAALASGRLAPGETVGLTVTVNTEGSLNWISKMVFVSSNDPDRQPPNELQLSMSGNVLERQRFQYSVPHLSEMAYVLLDVRDPAAYASGHLAGALNAPASEIAALASSLPAGALTAFYDQNGDPATLEAVTQSLHEGGVALVYALRGGLDAWQANYGSTRIVAGSGTPWSFVNVAGSRDYSASGGVRGYDVGRLLTDYVLIDIRPAADYSAGHLAGALNFSEEELPAFIGALPREIPAILYSADGADSDRVAAGLWAQGYYPRSLLGGLAEWQKQHGELLLVASAG